MTLLYLLSYSHLAITIIYSHCYMTVANFFFAAKVLSVMVSYKSYKSEVFPV